MESTRNLPISSPSPRRKLRGASHGEWAASFSQGLPVRALILCIFLFALSSIYHLLPPQSSYQVLRDAHGVAPIVTLFILLLSAFHLAFERPQDWKRNSRVFLIYLLILLNVGLIRVLTSLLEANNYAADWILLGAPYVLAPVSLTLLLGARNGFHGLLYSLAFSSLIVPPQLSLPLVLMGVPVGLTGIFATRNLRKRSQLTRASIYLSLTGIVVAAIIGIFGPLNAFTTWDWHSVGRRIAVVAGAGAITVTLVSALVPVLESLFRITTTASWIELSDVNHPLLREMSLRAPGTYFHSQLVANLAENAADTIGANGTICRVCAYFHDIGKLSSPNFFIENISGKLNPHDALSPEESARIISGHVPLGVDLALKHKLNREIIGAIEQHHGDSMISFCYKRAEEARKALLEAGNVDMASLPELKESDYRYPGPKPQTVENAILSLADTLESASRSWEASKREKDLDQLVAGLINRRLQDGLLDESGISLTQISQIRESFVTSLRTLHHTRIAYPSEAAPTPPTTLLTSPAATVVATATAAATTTAGALPASEPRPQAVPPTASEPLPEPQQASNAPSEASQPL